MINKIFLEYFQSIKEPTVLPLSKITLAFGPNSAGKSAVMDAIEFLKLCFGPDLGVSRENIVNKYFEYRYREHSYEAFAGEKLRRLPIDEDRSFGIGVGFEVPLSKNNQFPELLKASTDRDGFGLQSHMDILAKIEGHSVQIEIRGLGDKLSVAIDDVILFSIDSAADTYIDNRYNHVSSNQVDYLDDDTHISGILSVNLDHPSIQLDALGAYSLETLRRFAKHKSPAIKRSVTLEGSTLRIRGVEFSITNYHFGAKRLRVYGDNHLFDLGDRSFLQHYIKYSDANPDSEMIAFLEWLDRITTKKDISRLKYSYNQLGESLELLVSGVFHLAHRALDAAKVSGSRTIIAKANAIFNDENSDCATPHLHDYGRARAANYSVGSEGLQNGFVNRCIRDFIPSFRGLQLAAAKFRQTPIGRVRIKSERNQRRFLGRLFLIDAQGRQLDISDVGSGVSFVLPILTSLWARKTVLVEQPELHLHPAAQCEIGDVLIAAHNAGRQILLETHSEHLILRLLRRIRETDKHRSKSKALRLLPSDLSVLYFDPQADGTTRVTRLRVDKEGDFIDRWPGGFFSEREKELFDE